MNTDSQFRQAELVFQIYLFKYKLLKNNSEHFFAQHGVLIQLFAGNFGLWYTERKLWEVFDRFGVSENQINLEGTRMSRDPD